MTAGLTSATIAAVTLAAGVACLLATAVRHRTSSAPGQHPRAQRLPYTHPPHIRHRDDAAVATARDAWLRALLHLGILPFLRDRLKMSPKTVPDESEERERQHMTVNLAKGQRINLSKSDGGELSAVRMGLGWQAAPRKGLLARLTAKEIDLDASAVLFAGREAVDVVFFQHLTSDDGSVRHTGDNLVGGTGQGGDDESILIDLQRVPAHVDQILFTVNSFTGQTFAEVQNAFCRLIDETNGQELARYTLSGGGPYTAQIMAKVHREGEAGGAWQMSAIGAPATGRTFQDLLPVLSSHL